MQLQIQVQQKPENPEIPRFVPLGNRHPERSQISKARQGPRPVWRKTSAGRSSWATSPSARDQKCWGIFTTENNTEVHQIKHSKKMCTFNQKIGI